MSYALRRSLAKLALEKSLEVRLAAGLDEKSPICIYNLCDLLGVTVRFVEVNMEGMYVRDSGGKGTILLSALRPPPRKVFTCAHELGHHIFSHGWTIDHITAGAQVAQSFNPDEFLVDAFAGFLLMPTLGIRRAFARRGWKATDASPAQLFAIACSFGVGYETLVGHLTFALELLSRDRAKILDRSGPQSIRRELLGHPESARLTLVDEHWELPTIDIEKGELVTLPNAAAVEGGMLEAEGSLCEFTLYRAVRCGISRIHDADRDWAAFVRVAPREFVGLSRYRHLEEDDDEPTVVD